MKTLRQGAPIAAFAIFALLAACGGGGGGNTPSIPGPPPSTSTPTPTPTPTSTPSLPSIATNTSVNLSAYDGPVNGTDNWQTNGTTVAADHGDGDTASGATGSNTVDGINCGITNESQLSNSNYHVHAFVGIMVNGTEMAIPDAIGMQNPQDSGSPILNFSCAYTIHTHWASGLIHVEDPNLVGTWVGNSSAPSGTPQIAPPAQYNLQALLDIWGQSISSIGGATALTGIYVGSPSGKNASGDDVVTAYSASVSGTATPSTVLLAHHAVIWLVYGTPPAAGLPEVTFGIEN